MKFEINNIVENILAEHDDAYVGYQMSGQGTMATAEKFFNRELMTEIKPLLDELNDDLDGTGVAELHTVVLSYNGDELEVRFEVPVDLAEMTDYFDRLNGAEALLANVAQSFDGAKSSLAPQTRLEQQLYTVVQDRLRSRKRRVVIEGVRIPEMAEFLMTIPMNLARDYDDSLVRSQTGRRGW